MGGELLRLLIGHPKTEVVVTTSEQSSGKPVAHLFPNLKGLIDLSYEPLRPEKVAEKADFIFLALPHRESMDPVARFVKMGKRVVDLSADFRLKDRKVYKEWYKEDHSEPTLLRRAVYGLPELYREKIKGAALVANPGCYPTATILGLAPLIKKGLIGNSAIIIDAKSGISGAGRKPSLPYHFPEMDENLMAYNVGSHRHTPEIEQELATIFKKKTKVSFVPHLIPMNRGILATIYVKLRKRASTGDILGIFTDFYEGEPFIRVLQEGDNPETKRVLGSNFCDIGAVSDKRNGIVIVMVAIDNLVKGGAGQAIQNMNIMMGFNEADGLRYPGIFP